MTSNTNPDRRTVLKTVGSSVLVSGIGSARRTSQNSVSLIEAGLRYSIPDNPSYERYHVDRPSEYHVNPNRGEITLRPTAHPKTELAFTSADTVLNTGNITEDKATVSRRESTAKLPIEIDSHYRLDKYVTLAEPTTKPRVEITTSGRSPTLRLADETYDLPKGKETIVSLERRTVPVRTRVVTDEKADIPGVPEQALGYKVKHDTVNVTVTPKVVATNFGELQVKK